MQLKKTLGALAVCALFLTPLSLQAATCRAATAAETGSDTGYQTAKKRPRPGTNGNLMSLIPCNSASIKLEHCPLLCRISAVCLPF